MTNSPKTDALIDEVMTRFPGTSPSASARYFEAVHQELAPFARNLESQVDDMAMLIKLLVRALNRAEPGNETAKRAMDYLQNNDLLGSPLRAEGICHE